ncbi:MAG: hypothetical protein WAV90_22885, partial [Gordonia amarae]
TGPGTAARTGTVVSLRDQVLWLSDGRAVVVMRRSSGTATTIAALRDGALVQAGYLFVTDAGKAVILRRQQ